MADDKPLMNWADPNLPDAFKLFKQQCELHFTIKNFTNEERQAAHILYYSGQEGIKRSNAWNLSDEDKKKPQVIWQKFEEEIVTPSSNFRISRLSLRN
jgi:hypothetical protein